MNKDIIPVYSSSQNVNTISIICSATPAGYISKKYTQNVASNDNKIENIEYKYDERFDDPVYYFDHPDEGDGGGTISGNVLGV